MRAHFAFRWFLLRLGVSELPHRPSPLSRPLRRLTPPPLTPTDPTNLRTMNALLPLATLLLALTATPPESPTVLVLTVENPRTLVTRAGGSAEAVADVMEEALSPFEADQAVIVVAAAADQPRTFVVRPGVGHRQRTQKVRAAADLVVEASRGIVDDTVLEDLRGLDRALTAEFPGGVRYVHVRLDPRNLVLPLPAPEVESEVDGPVTLPPERVRPDPGSAFGSGFLPALGVLFLLFVLGLGMRAFLLRPVGLPRLRRRAASAPAPLDPATGGGVSAAAEPEVRLQFDHPSRGRRGPRRSGRASTLGLLALVALAGDAAQAQPCGPERVVAVDVSGTVVTRGEASLLAGALIERSGPVELVLFGDSVRSAGVFDAPEAFATVLADAETDGTTALAEVFAVLGRSARSARARGCTPMYFLYTDFLDDNPHGADIVNLPGPEPSPVETDSAQGMSAAWEMTAASDDERPAGGWLAALLLGLAGLGVGLVVGRRARRIAADEDVRLDYDGRSRLLTVGGPGVAVTGVEPDALLPPAALPNGAVLRAMLRRSEAGTLTLALTAEEAAPEARADEADRPAVRERVI